MRKHDLTLSWVITLLLLVSCSNAYAESTKQDRGYGVALNSAMNGQVMPLRLITTGFYYQGINQFELGIGFHPFIRKEQSITSADFNYKLFPNGRNNKLNMYLLGNVSYINSHRETFYPTSYHYLFLHGGYGIELKWLAGYYMDTNMSFGGYTYKKNSENPASSYLDSDQIFKEFGSSVSFQFSVGHRF